jgi:hypothetical protein
MLRESSDHRVISWATIEALLSTAIHKYDDIAIIVEPGACMLKSVLQLGRPRRRRMIRSRNTSLYLRMGVLIPTRIKKDSSAGEKSHDSMAIEKPGRLGFKRAGIRRGGRRAWCSSSISGRGSGASSSGRGTVSMGAIWGMITLGGTPAGRSCDQTNRQTVSSCTVRVKRSSSRGPHRSPQLEPAASVNGLPHRTVRQMNK